MITKVHIVFNGGATYTIELDASLNQVTVSVIDSNLTIHKGANVIGEWSMNKVRAFSTSVG